MRFTILALITSVSLTACISASEPGSYDSDLNRKTAGASVVSAFAKMCGGKRINEYRESFIKTMKTQRAVSPEAEAKIRAQYAQADASVAARFADASARNEHCKQYPVDQAAIDRGVAGDFTGQI